MATSVPTGYRERLWPSFGVWLATIGVSASFGLIFVPINTALSIAVAVLVPALTCTALTRSTPVIAVRPGRFEAGRAWIPPDLLGEVTVLDAEAMRRARGVDLDARAFLCIRGWISTGIRVELRDPQDPTPYWLVSSRRPDQLAAALSAAAVRTGGD